MKARRECWNIGQIEFCASLHCSKGWLIYGMIGYLEIMEDLYFEGSLYDVKLFTKTWAMNFANDLLTAAQEFTT